MYHKTVKENFIPKHIWLRTKSETQSLPCRHLLLLTVLSLTGDLGQGDWSYKKRNTYINGDIGEKEKKNWIRLISCLSVSPCCCLNRSSSSDCPVLYSQVCWKDSIPKQNKKWLFYQQVFSFLWDFHTKI